MNMEIIYGGLFVLGMWAVLIGIGILVVNRLWNRKERKEEANDI
jgi:hypothetical protein